MQHDLHTCTIIWWLSTFVCEALHLIWTSHENSQLYEEQTQNVQQNLSYWNMFCVGFDIISLFFLIKLVKYLMDVFVHKTLSAFGFFI